MNFYGYPNTRLRAKKTLLFDSQFFKQLLKAKSTNEIIATLTETEYRKDIEKGLLKHPGMMGIEEGLRLHLINTYVSLKKLLADNNQGKNLIGLMLARFDLHNIKTILRGFHSNTSKEEIWEDLFPAGELDNVFLTDLISQPSIKACIDQLVVFKVAYGKPLTEGYADYSKTRNLANLELKLDKFYYTYIINRCKGFSKNVRLIKELIQRDIDTTNLMTLLRLTKEMPTNEKQLANFYIEGGKEVSKEQFLQLAKLERVDQIIEELKKTTFHKPLKDGMKKTMITGSVANLERKIEDFNIKQAVHLFKEDPLSIGIVVAYMWAKLNEVINLRIILRGKEVEMPEKEIKEALVLV